MKKLLLFIPLAILMAVVAFLTVPLLNKDALSPTEDWQEANTRICGQKST